MLKRVIALLLCGVIAISTYACSEGKKVNAAVVVPDDDNTHYYVYNHIDFETFEESDFLTVQNYNDYYDSLSGNEKSQVNNSFIDNVNNKSDKIIRSFMLGTYQVDNNYLCPSDLYFTPITYNGDVVPVDDCLKFIGWNSTANQFFCVLYYNPNGDQIVNSADYSISESTFKMTYTYYSVSDINIDNQVYLEFSNPRSLSQDSVYDSTNNIYYKSYGINYPYFYYDDVCLFTSSYFPEINNYINAYNAYKNASNLSIDRRTQNFINKIDPSDNSDPVINNDFGFKPGSFDCTLTCKDFLNQSFLIAFDINNQSKSINYDMNLNLNYRFVCSGSYDNNEFSFDSSFYDTNSYYDSYKVMYSNYCLIDMSKVFDMIYGSDLVASDFGLNTLFQIANGVLPSDSKIFSVNDFIRTLTSITGFGTSVTRNKDYYYNTGFWEDFIDQMGGTLQNLSNKFSFGSQPVMEVYDNSNVLDECYIVIDFWLMENNFNQKSETYTYTYNYLTGEVTTQGTIEKGNDAFSGQYPTSNPSNTNLPSSNTGYTNAYGGSGGSASVGDITITTGLSSIPYLLVDIPENEWMSKTPNLTNILTDFKDMLASTKEESVLPLVAETYNYFPAPVMQYLIYGVGLIVMIGIWKAITRR